MRKYFTSPESQNKAIAQVQQSKKNFLWATRKQKALHSTHSQRTL